jgi:DNA replication protein DnaC
MDESWAIKELAAAGRSERQIAAALSVSRRTSAACFHEMRRMEDFDFAFNTSIKKDRVYDLATCRLVHEHRDVLLVVPPGTGKSHLA